MIGELANRMNAMIHRVKPDRSDLDMVFEVMLKLGVPPTYAVTAVTINGKTAYSVGEDYLLLVCLAPDVQPEDVEQIAEYAPAKAIISRDSFVDDTAMANAYYILRDLEVDGGGVPGFQVGGVQLEHPEAGVPGGDLRPGAADTLLADLSDVGIARLGRLAGLGAHLGELHQDETAVAAVLGVELHNGVGGGNRTGEEVENNVIRFGSLTD